MTKRFANLLFLFLNVFALTNIAVCYAQCNITSGVCQSSSCISNGLSWDQYNCPSQRCNRQQNQPGGCMLLRSGCERHCLGVTNDNTLCIIDGGSRNYKVCIGSSLQGLIDDSKSKESNKNEKEIENGTFESRWKDNCTCPDAFVLSHSNECPINKVKLEIVSDEMGIYHQCVDHPNYDIMTQTMAFSWCWSYKCMPASFVGKSIRARTQPTSLYNIAKIPRNANAYVQFLKPVDVSMSLHFSHVDGNVVYGDSYDVSEFIKTPNASWTYVSISFEVPAKAMNGDSGAALLYIVDKLSENDITTQSNASATGGSAMIGNVSGIVRIDRIVTDDELLSLQNSTNSQVAKARGYFVMLPLEFRSYSFVGDCENMADVDRAIAEVRATFFAYNTAVDFNITCISATSYHRRSLLQTSSTDRSASYFTVLLDSTFEWNNNLATANVIADDSLIFGTILDVGIYSIPSCTCEQALFDEIQSRMLANVIGLDNVTCNCVMNTTSLQQQQSVGYVYILPSTFSSSSSFSQNNSSLYREDKNKTIWPIVAVVIGIVGGCALTIAGTLILVHRRTQQKVYALP